MIFGADLSSYDGSDGSVVDAYQFVILNVKDPGLGAKVSRAKARGIPWAIYTWVDPGGGVRPIDLAKKAERDYGKPPKGVWLDYEEAGVNPTDLTVNLLAGEQAGMDLGVYTYLAVIPSVSTILRGHPLWLAYYAGNNDGSYPGHAIGDAKKWGAKIWQYTSSNGTRDLNVIVDEAWWATWGTTSTVTPQEDVPDMIYHATDNGQNIYFREAGGYLIAMAPEVAGCFYGKCPIIGLGDILSVVAWNARTKSELARIGK